jgi:hypothetical protein
MAKGARLRSGQKREAGRRCCDINVEKSRRNHASRYILVANRSLLALQWLKWRDKLRS